MAVSRPAIDRTEANRREFSAPSQAAGEPGGQAEFRTVRHGALVDDARIQASHRIGTAPGQTGYGISLDGRISSARGSEDLPGTPQAAVGLRRIID
jgi:hypothetical protein